MMTNPALCSGENTDCECQPSESPPWATTFPCSRCQICQPSAQDALDGRSLHLDVRLQHLLPARLVQTVGVGGLRLHHLDQQDSGTLYD